MKRSAIVLGGVLLLLAGALVADNRSEAEIYVKRGLELRGKGRMSGDTAFKLRAIEEFKRAIAVCPEMTQPYWQIFECQREMLEYNECLMILEKVYTREKNDFGKARVLWEIGGIYAIAGDRPGAMACYKKALKTEPEYTVYVLAQLKYVRKLLAEDGDAVTAQYCYEKANEINHVLWKRGEIDDWEHLNNAFELCMDAPPAAGHEDDYMNVLKLCDAYLRDHQGSGKEVDIHHIRLYCKEFAKTYAK